MSDGAVYPVIQVDAMHNQAYVESGAMPQVYVVAAAGGLTLNAAEVDFEPPENMPAELSIPDAVQILSDAGSYFCPWTPESVSLVLNDENLVAMRNSAAFSGFLPNTQYVIAIGRQVISGGDAHFYPLWAGIVDTKGDAEAPGD